jgi:McrBC 5-methylcytosine restriction system component
MPAIRQETLTESRDSDPLDLDAETVAALRQLGQRLASQSSWWGNVGDEPSDSSAVRCVPAESGKWRLRVDNAVGVISVADLQIAVEPKIPRSHLLHLFERSGAIPRTEDQPALVESDEPLWKLVMSWFVASTELLMRRGLMHDYMPVRADIPIVRGKVHAAQTVLNVYRGRILADCEF